MFAATLGINDCDPSDIATIGKDCDSNLQLVAVVYNTPLAFWTLLAALASLAWGLGHFIGSLRAFRRRRLIEDTPTSKCRSIAMGRVEVEGTVRPFEEITKSPFTFTECVWFSYELEKEYEYTDDKGNVRRGWRHVDSGRWSVPFLIEDDTGTVLVDPKDADIQADTDRHSITVGGELPAFIQERLVGGDRADRFRFTERIIRPGQNLFVLGTAGDSNYVPHTAQQTASGGKLISAQGGPLFISEKSQKEVLDADVAATQALPINIALTVGGLVVGVFSLWQLFH